MDEIQAAVLRVKLKYLDKWNDSRRARAALYNKLLPQADVRVPDEPSYAKYVYHLYIVMVERRDELRSYLSLNNIGTSIHYPLPVHLQPSYSDLNLVEGSFHVAERYAEENLCLPMFPELQVAEIEYVAKVVHRFYKKDPDETKRFL